MRIMAVDPGTTESAFVIYETDAERLEKHCKVPNAQLLTYIREAAYTALVIEQIESYGMPVGREVFETVYWSGRFHQAAYPHKVHRLPRRSVKLQLCNSSRATDSNVRAALLDRWGGKSAIGLKAAQGPLYGVTGDVWAALGVAVTWADLRNEEAAQEGT